MSSPPAAVACPVCKGAVDVAATRCSRCETPHHADCWEYAGGCAIFGCVDEDAVALRGGDEVVAEGEELEALAHQWSWVFRVHWWCFLVLSVLFSLLPMTAFVQRDGLGLFLAMLVLIGAFAGWVALLVPVLWTRHGLEARLGFRLAPPEKGVMTMLEHMELSRSGLRMHRVMEHWPQIYVGLVGLGVLVASLQLPASQVPLAVLSFLAWSVVGVPLSYGIREATRARVVMVEATQNRILASTKGRAALPSGDG